MNTNKDSEQQQSENIELSRLSRQGYDLIKQEKYDEALTAFHAILEKSEDNNYALVGIGNVLRKQRRYDDALAYYQRCTQNDPTNNFALFGIADIMRNQNNYTEAIEHWKKYLLYDKDNVAVITRVADSYRRLNDMHQSERYYKAALQIDPKNCYAFVGLGWLYFGVKDYPSALDTWLKVLDCPRNMEDIRIYTTIGNCYYKLKQYAKAIEFYQTAEKLQPENFFVLFGLANCHRGLGDHERSIDYLTRILKFDDSNRLVLSRLGDGYVKIGEHKQAKHCYQKALRSEFDIFAAFGLARLAYKERKYQEAISQLLELLQHKQISTRIYHELRVYTEDPDLPPHLRQKIKRIL